MRIALVIEHLDPRRGGAEVYVHDFARWLAAAGHDVTVVCRGAHSPPEGVTIHRIKPSGWRSTSRMMSFARRAAAALEGLGPDVSMATGKALGMTVYQPHGGTVRGSQRQNLALVRSDVARALKSLFNRISPRHRAARRLEQTQFANPQTHFVAISEMVRRDMRTFYGIAEHRITLVPNGVDLERFDPARLAPMREEARRDLHLGDGEVALLFVAHNFKLKGLGELIAALGLVASSAGEDRFRLLVVGKGRRRAYRRQARKLGIEDRVRFAGAFKDVAAAYAAADVFVHPTWYDPCSLVALEAMAAGLPVITTRFNGASELMTAPDGQPCGIVLDAPRPVAALAEALRKMLDADARRRMGQAARRAAEQHPQQKNFDQMLACLSRAAEEGQR